MSLEDLSSRVQTLEEYQRSQVKTNAEIAKDFASTNKSIISIEKGISEIATSMKKLEDNLVNIKHQVGNHDSDIRDLKASTAGFPSKSSFDDFLKEFREFVRNQSQRDKSQDDSISNMATKTDIAIMIQKVEANQEKQGVSIRTLEDENLKLNTSLKLIMIIAGVASFTIGLAFQLISLYLNAPQ